MPQHEFSLAEAPTDAQYAAMERMTKKVNDGHWRMIENFSMATNDPFGICVYFTYQIIGTDAFIEKLIKPDGTVLTIR